MRRRSVSPLLSALPSQGRCSRYLATPLPLSRPLHSAGPVGRRVGSGARALPLFPPPSRGAWLWGGRRASLASPSGTSRSISSSSVVSVEGEKEAEIVAEVPQAAAAQTEPAKKDVLIEETETLTGQPERLDFQSETAKLLDIVAHSLYTDKEVFVRELISNASDALEKLRHMQLSDADIKDKYLNLEIHISTDEKNKTIIIQDFGVGMSRDELVKNLGTIAHSGTQEYLRNLDGKDGNIIGQFGVGFYSAFMVGNQVKVYSLSAQPGAKGYCWSSEGAGSYTLTEAEGVTRGTKIVIKLRDGAEHFSKKQTIENIIKKYSNFVGFPIKLNGERINTIKPLWTLPKGVITEEEHKEFYQFLAHTYDQPMYHLHFTSDSPFSIQSLFYVPEQHQEKYGMGRMEPGVNLFSRKVLVKPKMKTLLPDWLRFIKGVVDCEDISLHLSREHFQDSDLIKRLGNVLTARILKFIQEESSKDPTRYNQKFWREFGTFLKEGICTDAKWKDELATLLRCESSRVEEGELVSLEDYVKRMPEEQNTIYYLCVPNRAFAESSPYYEGFKKRNLEVLFMYTSMDDFVMQNLGEFSGKRILSVESAQLPGELAKPGAEEHDIKDKQLGAKDVEDFAKWMKTALIDRVSAIKETDRLVSSPAIVVDHESASFRRMMKFVDPTRAPKLPKQRLEINPSHPIIIKLNKMRIGKPMLAKTIAEQVFDDALIAAGLMDDARSMLPRLNNILEAALDSMPAEPEGKK